MVLYGPDGVGKSSQIDFLAEYLTSRGYAVRKVWLRGPHTLAFLLSKILIRVGRTRRMTNFFGRVKTLPRIGSDPVVRQLWAFTEFMSVLPLILFRVMLPIKLGYYVVADRYVLDVIVSSAFYIDDLSFIRHRIASVLVKLIPPDSVLIHLDADYDTLIARRGELVEPRGFIDFQKMGYAWLDGRVHAHYIDTSKLSIEETSKAILRILGYER